MLFGLSVAPLHSDLRDLCSMLHANAAAAFKASLFDLKLSEVVTSACSDAYFYILFYPEADDNML